MTFPTTLFRNLPDEPEIDLDERGFRHLPVRQRVESYIGFGTSLAFWLWLALALLTLPEHPIATVVLAICAPWYTYGVILGMRAHYKAMRESSMFSIFIHHFEAQYSIWTKPLFGVRYHCTNKIK